MANHTHPRSNRAVASAASGSRETFRKLSLSSAVALALAAGYAADTLAAPKWAEGRILVQSRAGLADAEFDKILKPHGGRTIGHIRQLNLRVVEVPPRVEQAVARALANNPHVKFAELDMLVELQQVPNDPNYASAWHLPKIQAPSAWDSSQGSCVIVAILDTGVDSNHPDLNGTNNCPNGKLVPGWNSAGDPSITTTADGYGHGTMVAGTAAATTNNGLGVAGVAGAASIMPIRVTNSSDGSAYFSAIANGLTWAADHGARVANISYDMLTTSSSIASAAQYMIGKGGVVVGAAGNSGTDRGYSDSPYIISVSATDSNDAKASWSSYGYYVDVAAPGVGIWTTTNGGGYGAVNGTSFASPVTAGVVALMMAANPSLSPAQLEQILESTADDLGATGEDTNYGSGRVNAAVAVDGAKNAQATDTQAPSASITPPAGGGKVVGVTAVNVSASDNIGVTKVELYVDNGASKKLVGTDTNFPFGFSWDTTGQTDGNVSLVAYAYDAAGNKGTSNSVSVTVDNEPDPVDTIPPTVKITNPVNGAKVAGRVTIQVSASDNVGVAKTTCSVISKKTGKTVASSVGNGGSLNFTWNATRALAGEYTITAIAEDTAVPTSNKASTSITVIK